jgi:hypothetical protein
MVGEMKLGKNNSIPESAISIKSYEHTRERERGERNKRER